MKRNYNAVIIGGGASGLACAIRAKLNDKSLKIAIIEKNDRVGKKLLATGNGRCNLTNKAVSPEKYIGSFKPKCEALLKKYDVEAVLGFFRSLGLLARFDSEGRCYPRSNQASSVLDVLRFACERLGVEIFCSQTIKTCRRALSPAYPNCTDNNNLVDRRYQAVSHKVKKSGAEFCVKTETDEFYSQKLVIACGSKAAPKLGGTAGGLDYLKNFGHNIVPFKPALCPVRVKSDLLKSVKGLRAMGRVSLFDRGERLIKAESGEIQFTENALSGICVFNLSLYNKDGYTISVDLFPENSEKELLSLLKSNRKLFSELSSDNIFTGSLHKRLAQLVLKTSGFSGFSKPCGELSDSELQAICRCAKDLRFKSSEGSDFSQAQCASGGVLGSELDENTMQSKKQKNLYVCGEVIDLCGECGGYNLHFAFASGMTVGDNL